MNIRAEEWVAEISRRFPLVHTVRAARRRGKRPAGQLVQSPCQGTPQVIAGISVMARKAWTSCAKQIRDGGYGCSLAQQLFGDPLVGNTPTDVHPSDLM